MAKLVHNVQKKQHRERSQIASRSRYGLLEKKKDYRLRADDYHEKQAQLKLLKEKARYANDDEYFHAMVNRKTTKEGILIDESELGETLNHEQIRLLKSQDLNYVNVVTSRESKKVQKSMNNVGVFKSSGQHTVFVDDESSLQNFDAEKHFNTTKELIGKRENRLKVDQLLEQPDVEQLSIEDRILMKKLELEELRDRIDRENKLKAVRQKLLLQKEMMKDDPGMRKMKDKQGKTYYKWKNQRKR